MMRGLVAGFLIALSLSGQNRFQAVKQALDLTDAQIAQLQPLSHRPPWEADRQRDQILNDAQRAKIMSIRKMLYSDAAKLEARLRIDPIKRIGSAASAERACFTEWSNHAYSDLYQTCRQTAAGSFRATPARARQSHMGRDKGRTKRKQHDALLNLGRDQGFTRSRRIRTDAQ